MNSGPANTNSAPRLAGGNTIRQALKPSKAPVSMPHSPITVTQEEWDALRDDNERLRHEKLRLEDQLISLSARLQRANDTIDSLRRTTRRFAAKVQQPTVTRQ